jgi:hypothetical protein
MATISVKVTIPTRHIKVAGILCRAVSLFTFGAVEENAHRAIIRFVCRKVTLVRVE